MSYVGFHEGRDGDAARLAARHAGPQRGGAGRFRGQPLFPALVYVFDLVGIEPGWRMDLQIATVGVTKELVNHGGFIHGVRINDAVRRIP